MTDKEYNNIKAGQHFWATSCGELLVVLKTNRGRLEVCGAWECGIGRDEIQMVGLIDVPLGHENDKLYYIED